MLRPNDPSDKEPLPGPDHRPFSDLGDLLVYGRKADRSLIHVSEAIRGVACECTCPACEGVLSAKKGDILQHHFAHTGDGCGGGPETNAHIWAKEVLEREKWLMLPAVYARYGGHMEQRYPARIYRFAKVMLEKRLGSIVPDVILETGKGAQLIVEVKVTHGCEPAKLEALHRGQLSSIEIDLGRFRTNHDRKVVEHALLEGAPRFWLENARQAEFDAALRSDIERQERLMEEKLARDAALAANRERERERQARIQKEHDYQRLVRAALGRHPLSAEQGEFIERVFSEFEGLEPLRTQAVGFRHNEEFWQAKILDGYLSAAAVERSYEAFGFSVEEVCETLWRQMVLTVGFGMTPEFDDRYRKEHPDKVLPKDGVAMFLRHLTRLGYLDQWRNDGEFGVSPEYRASVLARAQQARALDNRTVRLREKIMSLLKVGERIDWKSANPLVFDFDEWFEQKIDGDEVTPGAICSGSVADYEELLAKLKKIEIMLAGGPLTDDFIGLPFAVIADKLAEKKRERARLAVLERQGALRSAADRALGADASIWLSAPSDIDPMMSRIDLAGRDSISFQRARSELEKERGRRSLAEKTREALRQCASAVFADERLDLFLNASHPKLGMSPIAYCIDQRTLRDCLALLPAKRGR